MTFGVYAIALFGFHVLDPVPAARRATLTQMRDGMVVVDGGGRIVDVNPGGRARPRQAGVRAARPPARRGACALRSGAPQTDTDASDGDQADVGPPARDMNGRHYVVETKSLEDRRSRPLGRLILLHDVTEQQQAQARLLEQERVVATLQERERLARELHDSVGQVLGYVSMQAQTASKCLRDGDAGKAEPLLARLASVAQHAHADVRESILALHTAPSADWAFVPTLQRHLEDFETQYGVTTELTVDGLTDDSFPPEAGPQLLRVIQEAMTNARRHGHAQTINVAMERRGDDARITVADDGRRLRPAHAGRRRRRPLRPALHA